MKNIKNVVLVFFALIVIGLVYFITYTYAEPKAYDFMVRNVLVNKLPFDNVKVNTASDDINLIVIDDKTELKYRWPWKRELYCKFFEYLYKYAQPKLVIYDALVLTLDKENPESDKKFFNTINKFDNLIVGFKPDYGEWEDEEFGAKYTEKFAEKFALKNVENNANQKYDLFYSILPFPDTYLNSIKNVGSVSVVPGYIDGNLEYYARDNVYRNYSYMISYDGKFYPSMALNTLIKLNNTTEIIANNNNLYFPSINYKVPQKTTTYQMSTPLKFYSFIKGDIYSHKKYSAVDIMDSYDLLEQGKEPIVNPEEFKNKIVFLGANVISGAGLNDNLNTPVSEVFPGVEYLATATDNILHNDFLTVLPQWFNLITALLCVFLIYWIIKTYDWFKSISYAITLAIIYILISTVCFYYCIVINVITPVVMIVLAMIASYLDKYVIETKNKEKVQLAMGKYMSEDVMKSVLQNIDDLGLGGKKAVVTVLFSDIRGFTTLSEKMSAQQVSEILNEYFSEMEPIVTKYNGIINKFIGDAIMAVFGEPINDENHPLNAVKCGYEMLMKVEELHKKWEDEGKPLIEIGVGINTGEVFVGNIGSVNRMEYTVIGDTVNLASRLESYNKTYRTKMLISSSTYEYAKKSLYVVKIPDVEIRGKQNKLDIYEVLKVI